MKHLDLLQMAGESDCAEGRNAREEAGFLGAATDARKTLHTSPDGPQDTLKLIERYQAAFAEMSGDA